MQNPQNVNTAHMKVNGAKGNMNFTPLLSPAGQQISS